MPSWVERISGFCPTTSTSHSALHVFVLSHSSSRNLLRFHSMYFEGSKGFLKVDTVLLELSERLRPFSSWTLWKLVIKHQLIKHSLLLPLRIFLQVVQWFNQHFSCPLLHSDPICQSIRERHVATEIFSSHKTLSPLLSTGGRITTYRVEKEEKMLLALLACCCLSVCLQFRWLSRDKTAKMNVKRFFFFLFMLIGNRLIVSTQHLLSIHLIAHENILHVTNNSSNRFNL